MSIFARMKLFQKVAMAILAFFMGLMVFVTIVAHVKRPGAIGMDMMKVQQMQHEKMNKREIVENP
jgi:hypothetical protein